MASATDISPPTTQDADDLVVEHLDLARRLALRYARRGVETDDLVQVANLALVKAARNYDAGTGDFAPYAAATIRGHLKRHFRDHAWMVRPPRRVQELQAAITAEAAQPGQADVGELAESFDVAPEAVTEALAARGCFACESLDRPVGADGPSLGERLGDGDPGYDAIDESVTLRGLLEDCSCDEKDLLHMRFVEECTQQEIADRLGISQMQVSRRLRRLLDTMRERADVAA
ncbi:sigma-70 family RNA polymerase sigma factor [Aeromicrobium terrae]|uniref:Sigma-70 family RNA polymerase sigma factor n=1 Tax=Aeromicrobium terrae TaxID=2498846 RepID=A0A5C8NGJ4_9ACTN|nr:sigma-70 family RNA polymerase sigma factor [Aeromicrobium terrae]TXL60939.1 sigma-70 family RNA polymerase sigma factor [Aeromicrobium terrae]